MNPDLSEWNTMPAVRCPRTGKLHPDWTNLRVVSPHVVRYIDLADPRPVETQIAEGYKANSGGLDLHVFDPRDCPVEETPRGAVIPPQDYGDMELRELSRTVTPLRDGVVIVFQSSIAVLVREGRTVWAAWLD